MAQQIYYNYERLRQAVVLLLSRRFGNKRSTELRRKIEAMPRRPSRYQKPIEELNEFLLLAHQSKDKALELLDLIDRRRPVLLEAIRANDPEQQERRDSWAKRMRDYRARLSFAVKIREAELGRDMTSQEAKDYQKAVAAEWTARRAEYRKNSGLRTGDANLAFTRMLDEELDDRFQAVKREQERRRLSDPSFRRLQKADKPDLSAFVDKFNRKHRGD